MVKKIFAMCVGLMVWLIAVGAHAEVSVVGELGTTGVGGHAVIPLRPNLQARVGLGYLTYSYSGSTRDMKYGLSMKTNTYDALLDWYPKQDSSFRVTAGLAYNGNKIDVQAHPDAAGNYTVGGNTYDATSMGKVTGRVDFGKAAPYLGVGWSSRVSAEKGWSFSSDVGVLFQGAPRSTLQSSGCSAPQQVCGRFASDLARENVALADEVGRFKAYPVLRVGISYKF